jgi:hypothetical protein
VSCDTRCPMAGFLVLWCQQQVDMQMRESIADHRRIHVLGGGSDGTAAWPHRSRSPAGPLTTEGGHEPAEDCPVTRLG